MSRGWLSPTSLMLHEDYSFNYWIPMHGDFFMSNHSSYLQLGWIFYIIYYVSRLFLMNLGDSFVISIFVDESSRFAAKISASSSLWGSRCWNCNDLGVVYYADFWWISCSFWCDFVILILKGDEQQISRWWWGLDRWNIRGCSGGEGSSEKSGEVGLEDGEGFSWYTIHA